MKRYLGIILSFSLFSGCGAPTKSAGDVAYLFDGDAKSLQAKETDLCGSLSQRTEAPSTRDLSVDMGGCGDAGQAALDYKKIDSFYFMGLDDDGSKDSKILHRSARSQVWLNKSLLGLAGALSGMLKDKAGSADKTGLVKLDDSGNGQLQNIAKTTITVLEEPKIDTENLSFSTLINFKVEGIVAADHDIRINGRLIDNAFAVTVSTTEDRDYKQSILKNFNAVILIIPHASDVYVDLFVDLNIHNPGLDSLFKEQVNSFLSTGLKSAIDSMMAL